MCPQVYQKCRCHLNALGTRKQTLSKFRAEDPQIFGASHIKCSTPSDLEPENLCVWSVRVTTDKLFYIGTINWSYMQTHCCIPSPCQMVGEGVGGLVENSNQLNIGLYC